jgi:hypothetical protein
MKIGPAYLDIFIVFSLTMRRALRFRLDLRYRPRRLTAIAAKPGWLCCVGMQMFIAAHLPEAITRHGCLPIRIEGFGEPASWGAAVGVSRSRLGHIALAGGLFQRWLGATAAGLHRAGWAIIVG